MSHNSINPGFFLRYFVTPALAFSVLAAPTSASASDATVEVTNPIRTTALFAAADELHGKVNINTATSTQLEMLPGIGPATAEKIIAYRAKYPFKEPLHLLRVKGVGRKTFARIKPFLSVQGASDLVSTKSKPKTKAASN